MDSTYSYGWPGFANMQTDYSIPQLDFPPAAYQERNPADTSVAPHLLQAGSSSAPMTVPAAPNTTLPACAGCRMRRVKCVRETQNEEDSCAACQKKGIRCLPVAPKPKGKRKYGERAGDRIQAAKAQCGSARSQRSASPLSLASTASRLDEVQMDAAFCSALVDDYYRCALVIQPCINWKELRYRFAAVGYRLTELNTPMQALLSVIVTIASRITSHHSVIGLDNSPDLFATQLDVEFSTLGERRQAVCKSLLDEAERLLDQGGLLSVPSAETIAARYLLGSFYLFTDKSKHGQSRQLTASAISHLRHLYEEGLESDTHNSVFSDIVDYTLCVSDALFSAKTGRSLQVTEDDLLLFLREAHYREEELTAQIVEDIVADPSDKLSVGKFAQRMWWQVISLGRSLVSTTTGTLASRTPVNLEALFSFWNRYDALWNWMENAKARLFKDSPAAHHLELARCCLLNLNLACHAALKKRRTPGFEDILVQAEKRVQQAAISMAEHIEMMVSASSNIVLATSCQTFQSDMDEWILHLRCAPAAQEAGQPDGRCMDLLSAEDSDYTIQRKMQLIQSIIAACKAFSHSWPGMAPRVVALSAYLSELESLASTTTY